MAEKKIASDIKKINSNINDVYNFLSDFKNIEKLLSMAKMMGVKNEELAKISDNISNVEFTNDSCSFDIKGGGRSTIMIIERDEPKTIKICSDSSQPIGFILWIQLVEAGAYDTRLRLTVNVDLNFMLKMMVGGKLEKGVNQFADQLAQIPYGILKEYSKN